jgi:RNA polymerase-binding transcription factor DksA
MPRFEIGSFARCAGAFALLVPASLPRWCPPVGCARDSRAGTASPKQPAFRAPGTPVAGPAIARRIRRRIKEEWHDETIAQSNERADAAPARGSRRGSASCAQSSPASWCRRLTRRSPAAAGEVRDAGDEAVVVERTDVRTALMQRDAREVGELQSALGRLDDGHYGVCAECGLDIEDGRLRVLPTALRCSGCQEAHEHRSALAPGR